MLRESIAVTVVEATPNVVTQVKTVDSDGYNSLQLAFGEAKEKNTSNQNDGSLQKQEPHPKERWLSFAISEFQKALGDTIAIDEVFAEGDKIRAVGTSRVTGASRSCKTSWFQRGR